MLVKEFSGKNERDAINKALETLKLTEDQVRVEIVDKGKRSLLGFGEESPTVIRVYYEEISTSLSDFKTTVETILKYMGITAEVSVKEESETKIFINIQTEDSGVLIGKKGATLEALQFLISMMATKHIDDGNDNSIIEETETKRHIILDVDGYRDRREETLKHIARQSAATAKRTRRPISLDPMSPYERRVIHVELQEDPEIETRSEGEPPYRCVKIFPKRTAGDNRTGGNYRSGGQSPRRYNNNGNRDRNYNSDKYGSGNY